jgi:hypothetical protein
MPTDTYVVANAMVSTFCRVAVIVVIPILMLPLCHGRTIVASVSYLGEVQQFHS